MKVIFNGKIYLQRETFCEALLVDKGRIVKTASSCEIFDAAPSHAEKIDAKGALVLPAFNDSHLHLIGTGKRAFGIECAEAKSIEEIILRGKETIARIKAKPGTYVLGSGVNPDLFSIGSKRELTREDLDKISTEHPVILNRHCNHVIYCNSAALKLAGLSESAPDVEGGTIEKDENGRPSGVFKENALALARKPMPATSREDLKNYILHATKTAHSLGISSCGSNDTSGPDFENVVDAYREVYDEFRKEGKPGLRVTLQCGISLNEDILDDLLSKFDKLGMRNKELGTKILSLWEDKDWGIFLKMGSIKIFGDGSLGGHTAWLRQPYRDKLETSGYPLLDEATLKRFVAKADKAGIQVLVHAIGDAGMNASIKAFENVTAPGKNPLRHGIIHCQISSPDLLERMARNQILALVQPVFLADDLHMLESRVGPELASTSYAWGSMQRFGIPVSYGTDAPISRLDPLPGLSWAVERRDTKDPASKSYNPKENVDIYDAVDAYTAGAAHANLEDDELGRIAPGKLADMVFLDRDIFSEPEEIRKAKVLRTIIAGETVYLE